MTATTPRTIAELSHAVAATSTVERNDKTRFAAMALCQEIMAHHDRTRDQSMQHTLRSWVGKVQSHFQGGFPVRVTRAVCEICGDKTHLTQRRAVMHYTLNHVLRRARRGVIGADAYCPDCHTQVQSMPIHRECEYGGERRMPRGSKRCTCGRFLSRDDVAVLSLLTRGAK